MTVYKFEFSLAAEKDFAKLSKNIQQRIINKLEYFAGSKNPLDFAKKLVEKENLYRYRVGDYRLIVAKKNNNLVIILLVLKIGHRKDIYK